ncbi:unnamed protein product [Gordionus sp. m RMFG-2023]
MNVLNSSLHSLYRANSNQNCDTTPASTTHKSKNKFKGKNNLSFQLKDSPKLDDFKNQDQSNKSINENAQDFLLYNWYVPKLKFDDFIGYDNLLVEVCQSIIHLTHSKIYKDLEILPPIGLLIHGPPGTGKSMLAEAIAGEFSWPFLKIAGPEIISSISGVAEKKIRKVFGDALTLSSLINNEKNDDEPKKCVILFIDELDVITPKRESTTKDMERRIISQILCSIDDLTHNSDSHVLLIAATNFVDSIDPGIRRAGRFDREIVLGMPNENSRYKLLQHFCSKLNISSNIDFRKIVRNTPGFVAADLKTLIREATISAISRSLFQDNNLNNNNLSNTLISQDDDLDKRNLKTYLNFLKSPIMPKIVNLSSPDCKASPFLITLTDFETALKNVIPSCKREGFYTSSISTKDSIPDYISDQKCLPTAVNESDGGEKPNNIDTSISRDLPNYEKWDSDVGALFKLKRELTLCLRGAVKYPEVYSLFGLANTSSGVLLVGPPGCGKTLLAKAVARESALNFIAVKGPELLDMYVGETERAVRKCFSRARDSAPCLVFFDEIDSLCPKRGGGSHDESGGKGGGNSGTGYESSASRIVNQLLTEMDGIDSRKRVFVMGATNRLDVIDKAILRPGRFDKIFYVDLPNSEDRLDILKVITDSCATISRSAKTNFLKNHHYVECHSDYGYGQNLYSPCVDLQNIAYDERCWGFSGADLSALVKEASRQALKDIIEYNENLEDSLEATNFATKKLKLENISNSQNQDKVHENKRLVENMMRNPTVKMEHFMTALDIIKPSVTLQGIYMNEGML